MKLLSILLLVCSLPIYGRAADSTSTSIPAIIAEDFLVALGDAGAYYSAPFHFTGGDWLRTGAFVALAGMSSAADRNVKERLSSSSKHPLDGYWVVPREFGRAEYINLGAAGMYGTGLLTGMDDLRVTGRMLMESVAFSGSIVMALRFAAGRTRPTLTDDALQFNGFESAFRAQSFPSGHATVSFAAATVLSGKIDRTWATIGLYGLAGLDVFGQLYDEQHWFSDIVVGSVLGWTSALFVLGREEARASGEEQTFMITPSSDGLRVTYLLR